MFDQLVHEKKRFLFPVIVFLFVFYFTLPFTLAFFPEQMSMPAPYTAIPWAWIYAFGQFIMTWLLGWMYWRKAKRFDQLIDQMKQEVRQ
ncbi:DUF485 domain-containing protein [Virgibacillus sp. C22-A2]|uniref:DUF485 domain-containing protein n=1 Tax=Virgibacillus tibetensis TaxID=3042313 RepID=A0ABU6KKD2_9BACI|nr:DUF485 domain-containing protein [Virgibacillus sp. C22-A2]